MTNRSCLTSLVLVGVISLGLLPRHLDTANALTGIRYTLKIPIDDLYEEDGSFKPPVKINTAEVKTLMASTCKEYFGAKPVLETYLASGRQLKPTPLRPNHKFTSGGWVKDANGENLFRLRGMCVIVATITQRLPDSNHYSFLARPDTGGSLRLESGYSYTRQQLLKMKNGITVTRTDPQGMATFSPIPDIEIPVVSTIDCGDGILSTREDFSEESEEVVGEKIGVAYIGITNGIYRKVPFPGTYDPLVEMTSGNPMFGDTWSVEYASTKSGEIAQASELIPVFTTWKKPTDAEYKFDLRISYFKDSESGKIIVKEKKFEITVSANCKNAKVIAR